MLEILRWIVLGVWTALAVRLTIPAFRSFSKHRKYLDFIWLCVWGTAVNRLWLWYHTAAYGEVSEPINAYDLLQSWYFFAFLVALGFHKARGWYKDGPRIPYEDDKI